MFSVTHTCIIELRCVSLHNVQQLKNEIHCLNNILHLMQFELYLTQFCSNIGPATATTSIRILNIKKYFFYMLKGVNQCPPPSAQWCHNQTGSLLGCNILLCNWGNWDLSLRNYGFHYVGNQPIKPKSYKPGMRHDGTDNLLRTLLRHLVVGNVLFK